MKAAAYEQIGKLESESAFREKMETAASLTQATFDANVILGVVKGFLLPKL